MTAGLRPPKTIPGWATPFMTSSPYHRSEMRLYDWSNQRLYINAAERQRFLAEANKQTLQKRSLCLTLVFTGCRISEALALRPTSLQLDARVITFRTLKRRRSDVSREVPVPRLLTDVLGEQLSRNCIPANQPLWQSADQSISRVTAYRWVKNVMAVARIEGSQACPKGLRHGYGIHAIRSGVQLNMLQKWMGHASMATTAIYANALGKEELEIADRMWQG